ncbi:helix-turn-helix domain-containing protein [Hymenobacter terrenus]|uniref:helix-turn-helix domain-containing protein n=1 Tax=Hymenobacter terrenus TaxID=1629124 RepID=UPI000619F1F4|nr:helix-turn-helix domain-containing protein [Hymenobacter terrenus]
MAAPTSASAGLLPRLRAFFGLSQSGLGQCLGLSRVMVSQVERGIRGLPLPAALPQAALTLALHTTSAEPAPEDLDTVALLRHQRACQHRADQLAFELSQLPERVAWARRRLAALPTLRAALAPASSTLPLWLAHFESEARAELVRSGRTAQARLQLRRAGLLAEAAEAGRLVAEARAEAEKK